MVLISQQSCCPGFHHDDLCLIQRIRWQEPDKGDGSPAEQLKATSSPSDAS